MEQNNSENTLLFSIRKLQSSFPKIKISEPVEAYNFIKDFYGEDIEVYESAFILLLDRSNNTIGYAKISQGGIVGTIIDTKIIAKYVVDSLASGIVMAHNHPSGNLQPSKDDIYITKHVKEALKYFDCELLDHLIITMDGYTSIKKTGLI